MIGECLDVLPECITTRPAVNNLSITDWTASFTETGQLELSSELKYTVYSLFI